MIELLSDNIVSPLGFTTDETWNQVRRGQCALQVYDSLFDLPDRYCVSKMDEVMLAEAFSKLSPMSDDYTKLEQMAILSVNEALTRTTVDPGSDRVLFILSTTKGNVELLNNPKAVEEGKIFLWYSARQIAHFFLNPVEPIVVSNACISGVAAQITAQRYIDSGAYDSVIVIGVDVLSAFVLSGFQSFKALSPEPCRPFDADRCGLNLGEAAATVIFGKAPDRVDVPHLLCGFMANDANHISGPSREALGQTEAIRKVLQYVDKKNLAFVCAHGTATRYNDDMESVALHRSGLSCCPVYSLKSYFGHTLGAAGVLETVLAFKALKQQQIPGTLNFRTKGTPYQMNVSAENQPIKGNTFLKLMSGFGGSNAALLGILNDE